MEQSEPSILSSNSDIGLETPQESAPSFQYEPLNSDGIRIVILHPQKSDEAVGIIRCHLIHTNFLQKPQYEALSYTWGNPESSMTIFLNDGPVHVRENLYWALYYLRQNEDRVLWIDAICINQNELEERKSQVGLMDFIYSRSSCVLIWLARDEACTNSALSLENMGGHNDMNKWLYNHSYWIRLWIIQEVGLARKLKVCLGGKAKEWRSFITDLRHFYYVEPKYIKNLEEKRLGRNGDSNRLETLLETFQYAECEEPKDKIYGLLGLAHDCHGGLLEADYTKDLFDLYADVIRFFCSRTSPQSNTTKKTDRAMRLIRFSQLVQKLLGRPVIPSVVKAERNEAFQAIGAIVGKVILIGPTYEEMISSHAANKSWKVNMVKHPRFGTEKPENEVAGGACGLYLWNTTTRYVSHAVVAPRKWNANEDAWVREIYLEIDNHIGRDLDDKPALLTSPVSPSQPQIFLGSDFFDDVAPLGLLPGTGKEGDLICQFWKANVAALLRKEEGTNIYRVIGKLHLSTGILQDLEPVYGQWNEPSKTTDTMIIEMDIKTLSLLTR